MFLFPPPFQEEVVHDLYRLRETAHVVGHVLLPLLYTQRQSQVGIGSNIPRLHLADQSVLQEVVGAVSQVTQNTECAIEVLYDQRVVECETRLSMVLYLFQQGQRQELFRKHTFYK